MTFHKLLCLCTFVGGTRYVLRTSGRCPSGTEIRSISECSAAATYLNLGDQWASYDNQYRVSYDPPYCYYEGGSLKFNDYGRNTGTCSSSDRCLCAVVSESTLQSSTTTGTTTGTTNSTATGATTTTTGTTTGTTNSTTTGTTNSTTTGTTTTHSAPASLPHLAAM